MALIAPKSSGGFTPAPAGTHLARCFRMVDLGTQVSTFEGKTKKQRKIMLFWELPAALNVFHEGEAPQPFVVHREFTFSMLQQAALRQFLEGWRSRAFADAEAQAFDVEKLLGQQCMVNIVHKITATGNTRAEVHTATTLPKGTVVPSAVNATQSLSLDPEWFSDDVFYRLPEWIQEKIKQSPEYAKLEARDQSLVQPLDPDADEIPF